MPGPCIPIAKVAAAAVARPIRHAAQHVVARVVRHARPRTAAVAAPRPSPALQCLQKPGALPAGPAAAAPALRSVAASPLAAQSARLGAKAAGFGLASGGMGIAAAAGLAVGGAMMATTLPSLSSADAVPLALTADDAPDTMRMLRLAETIPGLASSGLPSSLLLPNQTRSLANTSVPEARSVSPAREQGAPSPISESLAENAMVDVPEPASLVLLGLGGLGALITRCWRSKPDRAAC